MALASIPWQDTQFQPLSAYRPRFREFASRIVNAGYDYVVPLEQKGILFLKASHDINSLRSKLRYRRAFDFMLPEEVRGKRVALVDNTCVLGKTLNRSGDALLERGVAEVGKFAFLLYEVRDRLRWRRLENQDHPDDGTKPREIESCAVVKERDYALMIEEVSALALEQRPLNPDHLNFRGELARSCATDSLISVLAHHGALVEYRRDPKARSVSLHYPSFSPLSTLADVHSGVNKVRISLSLDGRAVRFSPVLFPTLAASNEKVLAEDSMAKQIHDLLLLAWNRLGSETTVAEVARLNLYEAFTLAMRVRLACHLVEVLAKYGFTMIERSLRLEEEGLKSYYGDRLASQLVAFVKGHLQAIESCNEAAGPRLADAGSLEMFNLSSRIMAALDNAYRQGHDPESDIYLWDSVGLTVTECAERLGISPATTGIGFEGLNDLGGSSPHTMGLRTGQITKRTHRLTELGYTRLHFREALHA
jgi:hypothetical protein